MVKKQIWPVSVSHVMVKNLNLVSQIAVRQVKSDNLLYTDQICQQI